MSPRKTSHRMPRSTSKSKALLTFDVSKDEKVKVQVDPLQRQRVGDTMACSNCFKPAMPPIMALKHCGGCRRAWYCSKDCQVADWKQHKSACDLISITSKALSRFDCGKLATVVEKWAERHTVSLNHAANQALLAFKDFNTGGHLMKTHCLVVHVKEIAPQSGRMTLLSAQQGERQQQMSPILFGLDQMLIETGQVEKAKLIEAQNSREVAGFLSVYVKCEGMPVPHYMEFYVFKDMVKLNATRPHDHAWEKTLKQEVLEDAKLYRTGDGRLFELKEDGELISRGDLTGRDRS